METSDIKIPDLCLYPGEWNEYEEILYKIFRETLLDSPVYFDGLPVKVRRNPEYKGKHFSFWHLISEGEKEEERTPDFRRCERLSWISYLISESGSNPDISSWENKRGSQAHVIIWYEKENYAVILARRNGYYLLKTAYLLTGHRAKQFAEERAEYRKVRP